LPGPGDGSRIGFPVGQGPGNIRGGIQGVHEEKPAYDGFHIPPGLNAAADFQPGGAGKGYQVKGIPDPQKFFEERPGHIIEHVLIGTAHAGGGIHQEDQIDGVFLSRGKTDRIEKKQENQAPLFSRFLRYLLYLSQYTGPLDSG
jgi:hypothetical protein